MNVSLLHALVLSAAVAGSPSLEDLEHVDHAFPVIASRVSYGDQHHSYPATDIFCPVGSVFVAPVDGVVDYVSRDDVWHPDMNTPETRGGIAIAIVGTTGWRYYGSHLSSVEPRLKPGVRVARGERLGLTGRTGNARNTPPHLHFGISRPTNPDDWRTRRGEIAPYRYLKAWEKSARSRTSRNVMSSADPAGVALSSLHHRRFSLKWRRLSPSVLVTIVTQWSSPLESD